MFFFNTLKDSRLTFRLLNLLGDKMYSFAIYPIRYERAALEIPSVALKGIMPIVSGDVTISVNSSMLAAKSADKITSIYNLKRADIDGLKPRYKEIWCICLILPTSITMASIFELVNIDVTPKNIALFSFTMR